VGWWQVHQITTDDTGRLALLASPYFRDSAEVQHAFYLTWADPAARAAWIEDFSSSFWGARVQLWGIPAIAGGILALLVRPRNQA
jgi:hypothetical protein